jgi:hypothetical protein
MSVATSPLLSALPAEVLFAIFKRLDRPSKLSLAMTGPQFLSRFASYYDLERYRADEAAWKRIGLPDGLSWVDSGAQATIIRWLAALGCDDIDDPPNREEEEAAPAEESNDHAVFHGSTEEEEEEEGFNYNPFHDVPSEEEEELPMRYEETEEAREDKMVQSIISDWLRAKFDTKGECVMCAICCRWMLVFGADGRIIPWTRNMLSRPA